MGTDPTYSPEHKAELIRLVIHVGKGIKQSCELLAQGSGDLEPIHMNYESARKYVSNYRANVRAATPRDRDAAAGKLLDEMFRAVSIQATRLVQKVDEDEKVSAQEIATTIANIKALVAEDTKARNASSPVAKSSAVTSLQAKLRERETQSKGQSVAQVA